MQKIGEGKTATVYSDGKFAYKIYRDNYSIENIKYEVYVQNEIHDKTDLKVAYYENEGHQIKMTLFEGKTLAQKIVEDQYEKGFLDFVDLQVSTFKYSDLELLDGYDTFAAQVKASDLDETLKQKALESIDAIEKKRILCHLDFHPDNIIFNHDEYFIIDWTNAKLANPSMDIASTYIFLRQYVDEYAQGYLNLVIEKSGVTLDEIKTALPVMSFIRLRENEEPEQEELLIKLINGTDKIYLGV